MPGVAGLVASLGGAARNHHPAPTAPAASAVVSTPVSKPWRYVMGASQFRSENRSVGLVLAEPCSVPSPGGEAPPGEGKLRDPLRASLYPAPHAALQFGPRAAQVGEQ